MEQYVVTNKTKDLVYFKRVGREHLSDLIVTKKYLRELLRRNDNPKKITCEQLVSIEYASENDVNPMSFNGILKHNPND